ncbi:MAG TPA: glycoside hydrolase family 2 TIM barrel-domain containing protein [bacterium]|nr:glycoside hydrolase family 2 TIM barrel-domain containing protein [bacterium]HPN43336.1 glycoside hydrolase family 2 TIM barrel-domain containing protein [bacterium]
MKHLYWFVLCTIILWLNSSADTPSRDTIPLNGTWQFEQTTRAFPPGKFTRTIPVPGLIHLATPKIDQYDKLHIIDTENTGASGNPYTSPYRPRYNWYRRIVKIPAEHKNRHAVLTLLKSKYVTQVFVNGMDMGSSMACYTPVECEVTRALKYGDENEILVRVGDRAWLPAEAAGSTDKEKVNYLPGIWDDVMLSFTGQYRVHRAIVLPNLSTRQVTVKMLIHNFNSSQIDYGDIMQDTCKIKVTLYEKNGNSICAGPVIQKLLVKRENLTPTELSIPMPGAHLWSVDDPFMYSAKIELLDHDKPADAITVTFGMREFNRIGKHFALNGEKVYLRGTNITLHRFFEDPECAALPWDRQWVRKLLAELPKAMHWNAMRICVGIAPQFWYDIADECGLMLQNEWLYWQNHGWDEQIRKEYTDWVWSDGNHPSIVIWDAINENWDSFIGNTLIPELKKLDPTRIWDAGYMTSADMGLDEMDEPHPYRAAGWGQNLSQYTASQNSDPCPLGDLSARSPEFDQFVESSAAQLVNEYGWVWLWRDGRPAKLTHNQYDYFIGKNSTAEQNREFQAYWLQLETEWLRAERSFAGVLAFCYLTNNYGHTGDWFYGPIKDLTPSLTLKWFEHCFAPAAVFIDLLDQRYIQPQRFYSPGSRLLFNLVGVNDYSHPVNGSINLLLYNGLGQQVSKQVLTLDIPAFGKIYLPVTIDLPVIKGHYLIVSEYVINDEMPVSSRRYINVGEGNIGSFFNMQPSVHQD